MALRADAVLESEQVGEWDGLKVVIPINATRWSHDGRKDFLVYKIAVVDASNNEVYHNWARYSKMLECFAVMKSRFTVQLPSVPRRSFLNHSDQAVIAARAKSCAGFLGYAASIPACRQTKAFRELIAYRGRSISVVVAEVTNRAVDTQLARVLQSPPCEVFAKETSLPVGVVKVHYNGEVLRLRVGWPLKVGEVRSLVFSTLRDHPAARSCAEGNECPSFILYYGAKGTLLELCDATTRDFIGRHGDPVQPIYLRVVKHCPTSLKHLLAQYYIVEDCGKPLPPARCSKDLAIGSAPSSSITRLEADAQTHSQSQSPRSIDVDGFEMVNANSSEPASTAFHEASVVPASASDLGMDGRTGDADGIDAPAAAGAMISQQEPTGPPAQAPAQATMAPTPPTVAAEFLGSCRATLQEGAPEASMAPASASSIAAAGISLPIVASAAANAVGDAWESARDSFNDVWASGNSTTFSPFDEELRSALQASAASHEAAEKSAAESRAAESRARLEEEEFENALKASLVLHEATEKSATESKARLAKNLDLYKAILRPVEADGNCQFRALSVQLYGDETQHGALRQRVVQQLRKRRCRYGGYMEGSFEAYLERMARDSEWGDGVTLQAASDILNCEIHVLSDNTESPLMITRPEPCEGGPQMDRPLWIAFIAEVHYDAVIIETE